MDPDTREVVNGHFGNTIIRLELTLSRNADINGFFKGLEVDILERLRKDISIRTDDRGVLNFRIDKQEAYLGNTVITSGGDVIAVQIKPRVYHGGRDSAIESMEGYLTDLIDDRSAR